MIKSTGNHQTWVLWEMPWDMTWTFLLIRGNVLLSNFAKLLWDQLFLIEQR